MRPIHLFHFLLTALVCSGCGSGREESMDGEAIPVRTVPVRMQPIVRPIRTSGTLHASAEIRLSFKIGGIVERIGVREGERVRSGQILARLKPDEIGAQARQARIAFDKAQRDHERALRLFSDSVVTREQLQNAESGLDLAKSQLDIAEFNLRHAQIAAPSDGRVLKRLAEEGELVGAGHPVLLFGSHAESWRVRAGVADRDVVRIFPGDSAAVRFDAHPGTVFPARILEIPGAADPAGGLFETGLSLAPSEKTLYSGFAAAVEIFPAQSETMRIIPFEALVSVRGMEGQVFRVNPEGLAVPVPVQIAFFTDDAAVIARGLEGVASVVTEGAAYLSPRTKVRVVEDE